MIRNATWSEPLVVQMPELTNDSGLFLSVIDNANREYLGKCTIPTAVLHATSFSSLFACLDISPLLQDVIPGEQYNCVVKLDGEAEILLSFVLTHSSRKVRECVFVEHPELARFEVPPNYFASLEHLSLISYFL